MILYLLRHAHAEDHHNCGDAYRALTAKGHRQVEAVVDTCVRMKLIPHLVLTSPAVRALETATGFCRGTGLPPPQQVEWLDTAARVANTMVELDALQHHDSVMLVGHQPHLSELAAALIGCFSGAIEVHKASLVALVTNRPSAGRGVLTALIPHSR